MSPGVAAVGDFFHVVAFEVGAGEKLLQLGCVFELIGFVFSRFAIVNHITCYDGNTEVHGLDQ